LDFLNANISAPPLMFGANNRNKKLIAYLHKLYYTDKTAAMEKRQTAETYWRPSGWISL